MAGSGVEEKEVFAEAVDADGAGVESGVDFEGRSVYVEGGLDEFARVLAFNGNFAGRGQVGQGNTFAEGSKFKMEGREGIGDLPVVLSGAGGGEGMEGGEFCQHVIIKAIFINRGIFIGK